MYGMYVVVHCGLQDPDAPTLCKFFSIAFILQIRGCSHFYYQRCVRGAIVMDPDPGSGAFLTPGSGIRNRFFPDPGSRIPDPGSQTHTFESLVTIFWAKSSIILWKFDQIFFFSTSKLKYVQFCEISGYIKRYDIKFFFHPSLLLLFLDPGSGMGKNQDPGSGINIPDPQHCVEHWTRALLHPCF